MAAVVASAAPAFAATVTDARANAKRNPRNPNAQYDLGLALMHSVEAHLRAKQLRSDDIPIVAEAERSYKAALRLNKHHGRAHVMLGMLYRFTGKYSEAIKHLKVGMRLPKKSQDWWIAADTLVNVYFEQNKPEPAVAVLRQIVKQKPQDVDAHYKLGLAYTFTNKKPAAIKQFQKTLKLQPGHPNASTWLTKLQDD